MLKRSKKVKGLLFNITSVFEYAEFEFTNAFEPRGINVKWSGQNQSVDFSSKGADIVWTNTDNERNLDFWRVDFPNIYDSTLQLTMIKSKQGIDYEKTLCKYTIEIEISSKWKTIAEAEINLGYHINTNLMSTKLMIDLVPKLNYATKAVLLLDLKFEFSQSDDTPDYATSPSPYKEKTIFNFFRELNNDIIYVGAAKQNDIQKICSDTIYLIINQSLEDTSGLFKASRRLATKSKSNRNEIDIIYVSFMQNTEELTQIAKDECLEFRVIRGSQMLKDVVSVFLTGESLHLLIVTINGEVLQKLSGVDSIIERLERETSSDRISAKSSKKRVSSSSIKNKTADSILMETERKITALQEEKDFLIGENEELKLKLNRTKSEYDLNKSKNKEYVEAEENLEYRSKILQAERDIRSTLNKRGVKGLTGRKFRTRSFTCEDDNICYYDPSSNKMKGHISLVKIESVERAPILKQGRHGGLFYINTPDRVYEIQAQNDLHREKWMSAVEVLRGVANNRIARKDTI